MKIRALLGVAAAATSVVVATAIAHVDDPKARDLLPPVYAPAYRSAEGGVAAETFAPLAECGLFWWACIRPLPADSRATVRDCVAIVVANLASFAAGEAAWRWLSLV